MIFGAVLALWVAAVAEPQAVPSRNTTPLRPHSREADGTGEPKNSSRQVSSPATRETPPIDGQVNPPRVDVSDNRQSTPALTPAPVAPAYAQNASPKTLTPNIEAWIQSMQENKQNQPNQQQGGGGLSVSGLLDTVKMLMDDQAPNNSAGSVSGTAAGGSETGGEGTNDAPRRPPVADIVGEGDQNLRINIQDEDIRKVLEILSRQGDLNILPMPNVQGTVSAVLNGVDLNHALDAILRSAGLVSRRDGDFIFVGTREDFHALDMAQDRLGRRIYRPNYVTAADIQKVIAPMITPNLGVVSVTQPAKVGIESDSTSAGGDDFASAEAILVVDLETVLQQIDHIVAELDTIPPQVHIEAMILSVRVDDTNRMGIDWEFLRDVGNIRFGLGMPQSAIGDMTFDEGGLTFGFLDNDLGSFVAALEQIGDTNVIATPRLMCLNKQSAEILIGAQLGYVSTTQTETSTSQSVEFLEIGTQLNIRPFISNDGMIRMEVHPELSTGQVRVEGGFTLPDKEVTQVTTNVVVPNGCTVIIGGLLREDLITTSTQIPFLGSLPGCGFLFRTQVEEVERRELLILLTPRIVRPPDICCEGANGACQFHRRQTVYADNMCPLSKRRMGQRYFRAAQVAWAKGKRATAMRLINRSIGIDPRSAAAIDLRADICAGRHDGDHSGGVPVPYVPQTVHAGEPSVMIEGEEMPLLEGEQIPSWMLEELQAPSNGGTDPPQPPSGNDTSFMVPSREMAGSSR